MSTQDSTTRNDPDADFIAMIKKRSGQKKRQYWFPKLNRMNMCEQEQPQLGFGLIIYSHL